jgi:histidinol-phosphate/aromatic aminotransferase/cobyric acid decarboxylase-like protein
MDRFEHGGRVWDQNPGEWLDYSSNLNPLGCPEPMKKALYRAIDESVYYPDVQMRSSVRSLAAYLEVNEDNVLPESGGIEALHHAIRTVMPGRIIIMTPAFVEYEHIGEIYDIPMVFLPLIREGKVALDIGRIKAELRAEDLLIVCNPSNPLGVAFEKNQLEILFDIIKRKKARLLIDEAFIDFCPERSLKNLVATEPRLLIAGSLTKIFAVPGVRIGYMLAHESVIVKLKASQMPWVLSVFASAIVSELGGMQEYVKESLALNEQNRRDLILELGLLGYRVYPSEANFLFVDTRKTNRTASEIAVLLRKKNILVRDCSNYRDMDEYAMRLAVKSEDENGRLIVALQEIGGKNYE